MKSTVPCFLCGKQLDVRIDKNGKRYLVCNEDGMQAFIRRERGMKSLAALIRTLKGRDLAFRQHGRVLFEIQAILAEIRGIKEEMKSLDSMFNLLSGDKDQKRARKLLRTRVDRLLAQLEQIARS